MVGLKFRQLFSWTGKNLANVGQFRSNGCGTEQGMKQPLKSIWDLAAQTHHEYYAMKSSSFLVPGYTVASHFLMVLLKPLFYYIRYGVPLLRNMELKNNKLLFHSFKFFFTALTRLGFFLFVCLRYCFPHLY